MTRRHANFRKGDLAEGLGLELLRQVALVAQVPRQEDVGLDAIATILTQEGSLLNAGQSFWVQLKSRSRSRAVTLTTTQARWLKQRRLPVFFGEVTRNPLRLDLFSTNLVDRVWSQPGMAEAFEEHPVTLSFEDGPLPRPAAGNVLNVKLGPPAVTLTGEDLDDSNVAARVARVLGTWVEVEALNIQLHLSGGQLVVVDWDAERGPHRFSVSVRAGIAVRRSDLISIVMAAERLRHVTRAATIEGDRSVERAANVVVDWLKGKGVKFTDVSDLALRPDSLDEIILEGATYPVP